MKQLFLYTLSELHDELVVKGVMLAVAILLSVYIVTITQLCMYMTDVFLLLLLLKCIVS